MKLPQFLGQIIYFFGYPLVLLAIFRSKRAYVAIICENEALLTVDWLSFRHQRRLPGGGVKHHEDPLQAATREVYEELGIKINAKSLEPLAGRPIKSDKHFSYYIYKLDISEKPNLKTKDYDVLYTCWVKRKDVNNYLLGEEAFAAFKAMGWL